MKTTIKLTEQMFDKVTVTPRGGLAVIEAGPAPTKSGSVVILLTPDQAGALIFALEQACEANELAAARAAA